MSADWFQPDLFAVGVCGAVIPVLAFVGLLARWAAGWHRRALAAVVLTLGGAATAAAAWGLPPASWQAPALLACTCGLLLVLGSAVAGRVFALLLGVLRLPRLPWAVLLTGGPVLALVWAERIDRQAPLWLPDAKYEAAHRAVELLPARPSAACTDAGRPLHRYRPAQPATPAELHAGEAFTLEAWEFSEHAIRTAPADDESNCHGWVFGGGTCWIQGADVFLILQDNGYEPVSDPQPGDLIVYRDAGAGRVITHSGIVRTAGHGSPVLIESKMGRGGRFLHEPGAMHYGTIHEYYRSERAGHQLREADTTDADSPGHQ
jgi:hypothetical protein